MLHLTNLDNHPQKVSCNKIVVEFSYTFIGEVFLPGWVGGRMDG